jgi:hypothetical protein
VVSTRGAERSPASTSEPWASDPSCVRRRPPPPRSEPEARVPPATRSQPAAVSPPPGAAVVGVGGELRLQVDADIRLQVDADIGGSVLKAR